MKKMEPRTVTSEVKEDPRSYYSADRRSINPVSLGTSAFPAFYLSQYLTTGPFSNYRKNS